ncbi:MAG: hypothetical protein QF662_00810, partial [Phycisphaerae bacterium]|nr:hypothetical protein [Phycisphaerae bacterium]
ALLGMLMAILASMVSLTAYHSVRRSRGLRRGKQVAAAGLIGGGTLFLVFLIVAVWSFVDYANRPPCEENLQSIWDALGRYADTHEDKFPPKLEDLVAGAGLDRARLTCPAYRVRPGQRTYQYLANLNRKDFPADLAFVYDGKPRSHKDRLIRVLLIGGEIKKVPTADWDAFFAAEQKKAQDVMQMLHQKANPEPHDMFNKVEGEVGSEVDSAAPEAEDAPPETEEAGEAGQ